MLHAKHEQQQTPLNDVYVLSIRHGTGDGVSRHHLVTGDHVPDTAIPLPPPILMLVVPRRDVGRDSNGDEDHKDAEEPRHPLCVHFYWRSWGRNASLLQRLHRSSAGGCVVVKAASQAFRPISNTDNLSSARFSPPLRPASAAPAFASYSHTLPRGPSRQ